MDNAGGKAIFLPVIHPHHAFPVGGHFRQIEMLAKIGKIEDVLLETRAAKAHGSLEKLWTDPRVAPDGTFYIRAGKQVATARGLHDLKEAWFIIPAAFPGSTPRSARR